jgi:catechol 2,3-dioxygenase-like lactoylglutathione lyase family enzyme
MKKLFAICLVVESFDKSLRFYRDTLGMEANSTEGTFADFKLGETSLAIFEKTAAKGMFPAKYMNTGGSVVVAFQVPKLSEFVDKLHHKKVEIIEGPKTTAWGQKVAYFLDPDKNVIEISEG